MTASIYFKRTKKRPRYITQMIISRSSSLKNLDNVYNELNGLSNGLNLKKTTEYDLEKELNNKGLFKQLRWSKKRRATAEVFWSREPNDLPDIFLKKFSPDVFAKDTGPGNGLCGVAEFGNNEIQVNWKNTEKNRKAFGISESLYNVHPISKKLTGEPIADAFAVYARKDNALLVIADGVGHGELSMKASRCAVYGVVNHVMENIFNVDKQFKTSEIFSILLSSIDVSHKVILQAKAGLTTLCIAFIAPISKDKQFCICVVNVGDSLAYVFSRKHGIREVTTASHDITIERDIQNAQGAIGPVHENGDPNLSNLTCSITYCDAGDIVFLTSDGVSDNFDPVITKMAVAGMQSAECGITGDGKPEMTPSERHLYAMKEMERVILEYELLTESNISAEELCASLMLNVVRTTERKRGILQDPKIWKKLKDVEAEKQRDDFVRATLKAQPGKLDHASIVAYDVGIFKGNQNENYEDDSDSELVPCSNPGFGNDVAPIAKFDSSFELDKLSVDSSTETLNNSSSAVSSSSLTKLDNDTNLKTNFSSLSEKFNDFVFI